MRGRPSARGREPSADHRGRARASAGGDTRGPRYTCAARCRPPRRREAAQTSRGSESECIGLSPDNERRARCGPVAAASMAATSRALPPRRTAAALHSLHMQTRVQKMFTDCATPNALASYVRHRFSTTTRAIFYVYYYTAPVRYEISFAIIVELL